MSGKPSTAGLQTGGPDATSCKVGAGAAGGAGFSLTTGGQKYTYSTGPTGIDANGALSLQSGAAGAFVTSSGVTVGTSAGIDLFGGGDIQAWAAAGMAPALGGPDGPNKNKPKAPAKPCETVGKVVKTINAANALIGAAASLPSAVRDAGSRAEKTWELAKGVWDVGKEAGGAAAEWWAGDDTKDAAGFTADAGDAGIGTMDVLKGISDVAGGDLGGFADILKGGVAVGKGIKSALDLQKKAEENRKAGAKAGGKDGKPDAQGADGGGGGAGGGAGGAGGGGKVDVRGPSGIDLTSDASIASLAGVSISHTAGVAVGLTAPLVSASSAVFSAVGTASASMKGLGKASVTSLGSLELKAGGAFSLKAGAKGTILAGGALSITAPSVSVKGKTKIEGITGIIGNTGIRGNFTVKGETKMTGPVNIKGNTKIVGNSRVEGDSVVTKKVLAKTVITETIFRGKSMKLTDLVSG